MYRDKRGNQLADKAGLSDIADIQFVGNVSGLPTINFPFTPDSIPIHYRHVNQLPDPDRCVNGEWGAPRSVQIEVVGVEVGDQRQLVKIDRLTNELSTFSVPAGEKVY